jgi:hypothetical protein
MNDDRMDREGAEAREPVRPDPVPRGWLPDALPPDGDPAWDARVARIMAASQPELARLAAAGVGEGAAPWWSEMGKWWRPAAALAAAAIAALLLVVERPAGRSAPPEAVALTLIAAEGDPVALWAMLGVRADPVLALLAFEDHDGFPEDSPSSVRPPGGETR